MVRACVWFLFPSKRKARRYFTRPPCFSPLRTCAPLLAGSFLASFVLSSPTLAFSEYCGHPSARSPPRRAPGCVPLGWDICPPRERVRKAASFRAGKGKLGRGLDLLCRGGQWQRPPIGGGGSLAPISLSAVPSTFSKGLVRCSRARLVRRSVSELVVGLFVRKCPPPLPKFENLRSGEQNAKPTSPNSSFIVLRGVNFLIPGQLGKTHFALRCHQCWTRHSTSCYSFLKYTFPAKYLG